MKKPVCSFLILMLAVFSLTILPVTSYAETFPYGLTSSSVAVGSGSALASSTTQVGFGGLRWYVAGFNGTGINKGVGTIALLSKGATGTSVFSTFSDSRFNVYDGSALQSAVNALLLPIDNREQDAMAGLTLDEVKGTQPSNQKIWALSTTEASAVSPNLCKLTDSVWWLRSASGTNPLYVTIDGVVSEFWGAPPTTVYAVRPGAAVNLSSVLYAAPITGKGSTIGTMNSVDLSSEIKFTILDNTNLGLSVPSAPASLTKAQGTSISLDFSGAQTGTGKYVSCALVSQADSLVKYYAKLSTASSGTLSVPISPGIQAGTYTLLIYNEQVTSGDNSDYASTPVSINLTVTGNTNNAPVLKTGVLSEDSASVKVGSAYTVNLADIFTDPDGNELSYRVYVNGSSSATSADQNYSFTPSSQGTTTLRFTAYDGALESPSYTITLTATNVAVESITVTAENGATAIARGATIKLYCTVLPANATNKAVTWGTQLSGAGYNANANVDAGNTLYTYQITSDGTVTVKATAQDGSGKSGSCTLNFISNPVTGISVSAATEDVAIGESVQMSVAVTGGSSQSVTWSVSSGSGIASISTTGLLSLSGSGSVTVRATAQDGTGVFGEKTLTVKSFQSPPSAPVLASKTASSVTLVNQGCEYSSDGAYWQTNTTFSGLTPNTSYNFYARMPATGTLRVSAASPALSVTTDKATLSGTVSISGAVECGSDLTANTGGLTVTPSSDMGTLSYQWTRDGSNITGATGSTYSLIPDDFGKVINVRVSSSNCTGSVSSANSAVTAKGDPKYSVPTGLTATFGETLADVALPSGFTWKDTLATPVGEPGVQSFYVTYTPEDTICYNTITDISVTLTVAKVTTSITTAPTASAITYGDTLSDSTLSGGVANIAGSFTWTDATIMPAVSDSDKTVYSVTFTPADADHYDTASTTVMLKVNKTTPSVTTNPTASAITYGDTLADSTFSGGAASTAGGFAWTDGTVKPAVSDSDATQYSVTFTPADTGNYNTTTTTVALTVNKATPSVTTAPAASAVTYGDALTDSTLSGGAASIAGNFAWTDGTIKPAVSDSGTTVYSVTFTPTDIGNYNTTTTTVTLTVNKATPSVTTDPAASAITYGDTLADSTLSGGAASAAGSFAWTDGTIKPAVSDSGKTEYSVTFTPTETGNYNTTTTTVMLTVNKATPSVTTDPATSAITYGDTLANSKLSGGAASAAGSFAWTDGTVKPAVSDSGKTEYSVTFTPTDTGNYNTTITTVTLTVGKATPVITAAPAASAIISGDALSDSVLSGGEASTGGSFAWTDGTLKPAVSDSKATPFSVTFIPSDTANYNSAITSATLKVYIAASVITAAPSASAITYGDSLSASAFSGGAASVTGSFKWTDGTIKPAVSDSSITEYSVTFTPSSDSYKPSTATVKLTVNKATPSVTTKPAASAITYGQTLSNSVLSGGAASVAGSFAWTNGTVKPAVSDSGITGYSVAFTPADAGNYNKIAMTVLLTVNKADPVYTVPAGLTAVYGRTLADVSLPLGFSWKDSPDTSVGSVGSHIFMVAYNPEDTSNYKIVTIPVTLTVNKAESSVTLEAKKLSATHVQLTAAVAGAGGYPAGTVTFKDGDDELGTVSLTNGTAAMVWTDMLPGGHDLSAVYSGSDCHNASTSVLKGYDITKRTQEPLVISGVPANVAYGDKNFDLYVSGGSGDGDITFALKSGSALEVDKTTGTVRVVDVGSCVITCFKAADREYNSVSESVTIQVKKASPVIAEAPTASGVNAGSVLSGSKLTGGRVQAVNGEKLEGTFAWKDPNQAVTSSGSYEACFTPQDSVHYTAVSVTADITVTEKQYVSEIGETGSSVSVDMSQGSTLLSADQVGRLTALNADRPVVLKGKGYEITFPAGSLKAADEPGDLDLGISFNASQDYDAILSLAGNQFIMMLHFNYDGPLPGEAELRIYVGEEYAGKVLDYQYYNPESGELEFIQNVTVDTDGYVTVTQSHCSSYVFTLPGQDAAEASGSANKAVNGLLWWLIGAAGLVVIVVILVLMMKRKNAR